MNILCVICRDRLVPSDEIFFTRCGHVFHFRCLSQWLERSETCPQCREKTTKSNIYKVYFNLLDNEIVLNDTSVQASIDSLKFQILLKEKNIKFYVSKTASLEKQKISLRQEARKLESEANKAKSDVQILMNQIQYYKKLCAKYRIPCEEWSDRHNANGMIQNIKKIEDNALKPYSVPFATYHTAAKGNKRKPVECKYETIIPDAQQHDNASREKTIQFNNKKKMNTEKEAENQNDPSSSKTGTQKVSNKDYISAAKKARGNNNDDSGNSEYSNDSDDNNDYDYDSDFTDISRVSDVSDFSNNMVELNVWNTAGPSRLP